MFSMVFYCFMCFVFSNIYFVIKLDIILGILYIGIYWEYMNIFIFYFYVDFIC